MGFWPLVESILRSADVIVLIGDARMPEMSVNREIERKVKDSGKVLLIVFNKMDLISNEERKKLRANYPEAFFVSARENQGIGGLRRELQIIKKRMGVEVVRVGIVGYPNLGKSAVINALVRRRRTEVADKPGTTRGIQWIRSSGFEIFDTPGVIPYEDKSIKLVLLGSKSPEKVMNQDKVALEIIRMFISQNKKGLEDRYGLEIKPLTYPEEILIMIGKKRGLMKKGGEVDETKTAIAIIQDWQKGKLVL